MKIAFFSIKLLSEIDGEYYMIDLDDGSLFNGMKVFSWLNKYNAFRLSPKEVFSIEGVNISKNMFIGLLFAITVFIVFTTLIIEFLGDTYIDVSYSIKFILLMLSFFLVWCMKMVRYVRKRKKVEKIFNREIVWDRKVSIHFYSKKEKIKFILFTIFIRLPFIVILFILGIISFLSYGLLQGLILSNMILLVILGPSQLPKRFYCTCEK